MPKLPVYNFFDIIEVTPSSPKKHKIICRKIAEFFHREFRYDMVQFNENGRNNYCAYIFCDFENVVGACCFRHAKSQDFNEWDLTWIWIHPYYRNRGILTRHWPFFKEKFGDFHVDRPYSHAMKGFLTKVNYFKGKK